MGRYILGIDPGTTETAYCLCEVTGEMAGSKPPLKIISFAKTSNEDAKEFLKKTCSEIDVNNEEIVISIEHLESYGTAVGKSTFETAYYIGELREAVFPYSLSNEKIKVDRIYRHEEKMRICQSMKANDATIKRALIEAYAEHPEKNYGKGTKSKPDFFYKFKADCWSAFAICCTYALKEIDSYLCQ